MIQQRAPADTFNRPPRIARTWRVETVELPEPPIPSARHERSNWITLGMPLLSNHLEDALSQFGLSYEEP